MAAKLSVFVDENHSKLPTIYRLPKLYKGPYKSRFIANSSSCITTELTIILTSCLTAIKKHVIKYCDTVFERHSTNLFWYIKNSGEISNKLKCKGFLATSVSPYNFSTLYTTLLHNRITEENNQADAVVVFDSTLVYLDDLLNIDNSYLEYIPLNFSLNKTHSSDTEAPSLDLDLSIKNVIVTTKIYDKGDDFNFEIVNFQFIDGDIPCSPSYGLYISQLIRCARVCSDLEDFKSRNKLLISQLLKQGYRYFSKLHKAFSTFYYRRSELIVKYIIGL